MTIKCLYANGDSFVFAQGIDGIAPSPETVYDFNDFKRANGYPGLIASAIGAEEYINNSLPGGSNDRMLRTTIVDLIELSKKYDPSEVLVLIGWTSAERTEFFFEPFDKYVTYLSNCPPSETVPRKMFDLYSAYFNSEKEQVDRYFTQLIALQGFLKSKGFKYLFTESIITLLTRDNPIPIMEYDGCENLKAEIDTPRYVWPSFSNYNHYAGHGITSCAHPSKEGHAAWADHLLRHMREHEIL